MLEDPTPVIAIAVLAAGSVPGRGYDCATLLPSLVHVNDSELSANLMELPESKLCVPTVRTISPLASLYTALETS